MPRQGARLLLLFVMLAGCGAPPHEPCNGAPGLCDRPLNQVALATTHNAFATPDRFRPGFRNQDLHIRRQLEQGIRALMLDTYWHDPPFSSARATLCHRFCTAGGYTDLEPELASVGEFLAENPGEVVVLLLEQHSLSPERFAQSLTRTGLMRQVFRDPVSDGRWPTLGQLIESDQRLVVFYENEEGSPDPDAPPYYRPLWESAWETDYSFDSVSDFSCEKNRGRAGAPFFLVNHFISAPAGSVSQSRQANAPAVLEARIGACAKAQLPSFVAVDYFDEDGDPDDGVHSVVEAVARLNGLR